MSDVQATNKVTCTVCPHACVLSEHTLGICRARSARDGKVVSLNYGQATGLALDPIEKKPLARFHPGSYILSYGSYGCNLRCPFCQNSDISMVDIDHPVPTTYVSPEDLVRKAAKLEDRGNIGIAFTYNEPLVAPEYLVECGALAHKAGLVTVAVTNGYTTQYTLDHVLPHLDALNIDLKSFSEEGYRSVGAPGGLDAVKNSIQQAHEAKKHVEVTTLIVPGLSDDEELFREECVWLASIDTRIPLHLTRFFPRYKATEKSPTQLRLLDAFAEIARERLEFVYIGNV